MDQLSNVASVAGPGIGGGIGVWAGFKFLRWLIEFVFSRLDVSRSHLGQRLRHVEQELDAYREATMLLMGAVAKIAPGSPALEQVMQILRTTSPRATMDLDELVARLGEQEGGRRGKNN